MEIRPARPDDIDAVRRVARRAWEAAYDGILDEETIERTVSEWYGDDPLREALDRPGTAFLVAETDEGVAGFAHGVVRKDEGDLVRLYVDPDRWHQGIGTALVERLREDFRDLNMPRLSAIVLADNEMGNEFYRDLGFTKSGEGEVEMGDRRLKENVYSLELSA